MESLIEIAKGDLELKGDDAENWAKDTWRRVKELDSKGGMMRIDWDDFAKRHTGQTWDEIDDNKSEFDGLFDNLSLQGVQRVLHPPPPFYSRRYARNKSGS